jgi:hypothetical protein
MSMNLKRIMLGETKQQAVQQQQPCIRFALSTFPDRTNPPLQEDEWWPSLRLEVAGGAGGEQYPEIVYVSLSHLPVVSDLYEYAGIVSRVANAQIYLKRVWVRMMDDDARLKRRRSSKTHTDYLEASSKLMDWIKQKRFDGPFDLEDRIDSNPKEDITEREAENILFLKREGRVRWSDEHEHLVTLSSVSASKLLALAPPLQDKIDEACVSILDKGYMDDDGVEVLRQRLQQPFVLIHTPEHIGDVLLAHGIVGHNRAESTPPDQWISAGAGAGVPCYGGVASHLQPITTFDLVPIKLQPFKSVIPICEKTKLTLFYACPEFAESVTNVSAVCAKQNLSLLVVCSNHALTLLGERLNFQKKRRGACTPQELVRARLSADVVLYMRTFDTDPKDGWVSYQAATRCLVIGNSSSAEAERTLLKAP